MGIVLLIDGKVKCENILPFVKLLVHKMTRMHARSHGMSRCKVVVHRVHMISLIIIEE